MALNDFPAKLRLFVAVPLSQEERSALQRTLDELRPAGRDFKWVAPANLHLTLLFLGDVPSESLEPVGAALGEISQTHAPFDLKIQGVGAFPNPRRPRTVWAGLTGDLAPLQRLAEAVGGRIGELGYPPDKPFRPHITLGRARPDTSAPAALKEKIDHLKDREIAPLFVDTLTLYRSELKPTGPIYSSLGDYPLTGTTG